MIKRRLVNGFFIFHTGAFRRPLALLLPFALLLSCSAMDSVKNSKGPQNQKNQKNFYSGENSGKRLIENVPFYVQKDYQCGPASLAEVMNFYGAKTTPEVIASSIYSKTAKGTLGIDMLIYSNRSGFNAMQYSGGQQDIKKKIDKGLPLVVFVDYGFWVYQHGHFMVVVGYDANGPIVYSGDESYVHISWEDFMPPWKRTGYWTLLITPKKNSTEERANANNETK